MPVRPSPLSKLPLLLLTLLLMPATGLASTQEPAPPEATSAPAPEQPASEQKEVEAPQSPGHENLRLLEESERPSTFKARAPLGSRFLAETGLGLVGGAAGVLVGVAAGLFVGDLIDDGVPNGCGGDFGTCGLVAILGTGLGAFFGMPLGAWMGGRLTGADGNYGSAVLGTLVGSVLGFLLLSSVPALPLLAIGPPLLGAVIGYELSVSPEPVSVALGRTRLQPLLAVSPKGSFVGLAGHF